MAESLDTFPNRKIWLPSAEDYTCFQRQGEWLKAGENRVTWTFKICTLHQMCA